MAARYTPPRSSSQRRASLRDPMDGDSYPRSVPEPLSRVQSCISGGRSLSSSLPKALPTPNKSVSPLPANLLPSAPASPPTPAPSPTPHYTSATWQSAEEEDDALLLNARIHFSSLDNAQKQRFLVDILNLCDNQQLSFVSSFVSPRLRKDPFQYFPNELCLRVRRLGEGVPRHLTAMLTIFWAQVLSFIDDPKTLARASQVSKRWRELLHDDITWKKLCETHAYSYRTMSDDEQDFVDPFHKNIACSESESPAFRGTRRKSTSSAADECSEYSMELSWPTTPTRKRRVPPASYRKHFKRSYMVESAWNKAGRCTQKHVTPDQGVVTSLHLTPMYIVVALDNAKIHVYDTNGANQKTLQGHVMGVWAMVPWDDLLVSGGCDREVRVWNMATG